MTLGIESLKRLQHKKHRAELGFFLAEGEHLVQELARAALLRPALREAILYLSDGIAAPTDLFPIQRLSAAQMAKISDTQSPQGMIALVPLAAVLSPQESATHPRAFYFYEIQDPGNLGTLLRTLAWFGHTRCLLSPGSVDPFNPKVVRASMGAIFHVPVEVDVALTELPTRYTRIASLDMQGKPLQDSAFHASDVLVFGNEARGVPRDALQRMKAQAFCIAGTGDIESLNVAMVAGICAYELARR